LGIRSLGIRALGIRALCIRCDLQGHRRNDIIARHKASWLILVACHLKLMEVSSNLGGAVLAAYLPRLRHSVHRYMLQDHISQQMHTEGEGKD